MVFLKTKKIILLFTVLMLCTLLPNCGGGGSAIVPNPVINTPSVTPVPTINQNPGSLKGKIYNITNNSAMNGCTINLNNEDFSTTNNKFNFNYKSGDNIITISGPNNITYNSPIDPAITNQDFYLLPFDLNTVFLRAMILKKSSNDPNIILNKDTLRWNTPPKIRIYTKMPYSDTDVSEIANEINTILLTIKGFNFDTLKDLTVEIYDGSPLDDPEWITISTSPTENFEGHIVSNNTIGICISPLEGIVGITFAAYSDSKGEYSGGGITLTYKDSPVNFSYKSIIWHELGHALMGASHPFENIEESDWPSLLEPSNMNYTKTGKKSYTYSEYDMQVFKFIYSRPSNNTKPDTNPTIFTNSEEDLKIIKFTDPEFF